MRFSIFFLIFMWFLAKIMLNNNLAPRYGIGALWEVLNPRFISYPFTWAGSRNILRLVCLWLSNFYPFLGCFWAQILQSHIPRLLLRNWGRGFTVKILNFTHKFYLYKLVSKWSLFEMSRSSEGQGHSYVKIILRLNHRINDKYSNCFSGLQMWMVWKTILFHGEERAYNSDYLVCLN